MRKVIVLSILLSFCISAHAKKSSIGQIVTPMAQRCNKSCKKVCLQKKQTKAKCWHPCMVHCIDSQWMSFQFCNDVIGSYCIAAKDKRSCSLISLCFLKFSDEYGVNWYSAAMCIGPKLITPKKKETRVNK